MFAYRNELIRVLGAIFSTLLLLAPAWGQAPTCAQFEQLRKKMVDEVVVGGGVKDSRAIEAMLATPRNDFVAAEHRRNAYFDMALPIGGQQTISSPFIVIRPNCSSPKQPTRCSKSVSERLSGRRAQPAGERGVHD